MKIEFSFDTPHGVFKDAIVLPDDVQMSENELEALKKQRFDAWQQAILPQEES